MRYKQTFIYAWMRVDSLYTQGHTCRPVYINSKTARFFEYRKVKFQFCYNDKIWTEYYSSCIVVHKAKFVIEYFECSV